MVRLYSENPEMLYSGNEIWKSRNPGMQKTGNLAIGKSRKNVGAWKSRKENLGHGMLENQKILSYLKTVVVLGTSYSAYKGIKVLG